MIKSFQEFISLFEASMIDYPKDLDMLDLDRSQENKLSEVEKQTSSNFQKFLENPSVEIVIEKPEYTADQLFDIARNWFFSSTVDPRTGEGRWDRKIKRGKAEIIFRIGRQFTPWMISKIGLGDYAKWRENALPTSKLQDMTKSIGDKVRKRERKGLFRYGWVTDYTLLGSAEVEFFCKDGRMKVKISNFQFDPKFSRDNDFIHTHWSFRKMGFAFDPTENIDMLLTSGKIGYSGIKDFYKTESIPLDYGLDQERGFAKTLGNRDTNTYEEEERACQFYNSYETCLSIYRNLLYTLSFIEDYVEASKDGKTAAFEFDF